VGSWEEPLQSGEPQGRVELVQLFQRDAVQACDRDRAFVVGDPGDEAA
jgi:hypothetical protein